MPLSESGRVVVMNVDVWNECVRDSEWNENGMWQSGDNAPAFYTIVCVPVRTRAVPVCTLEIVFLHDLTVTVLGHCILFLSSGWESALRGTVVVVGHCMMFF